MRPVDSKHPVTLGYRQKMRSRPTYVHRGIDYGCPVGTPVKATKRGKVVHAGRGGMGTAFGIHVVLLVDGIYVIYAHLSSESVRVGQIIETGQQLGKSGATGNVTGPHLHYGEFTTFHYQRDRTPKFIDYQPTKTAPAKPVEKWADGLLWNLAASDSVRGKATWDRRVDDIIRALKHYNRTILHLVEAETEGLQGRTFKAALSKAGWDVAAAGDQRMVAAKKACDIGATKVIELDDRGPANDDKQIVLAEIWTPGVSNALAIECGHFEYRTGPAFDKTRGRQAKQTRTDTLAWADGQDIPASRVIFGNDENARVGTNNAFGTTFPSLRSRSDVTYGNAKYSTICGWDGMPDKPAVAYDPDKVRVHKSRPMVGGSTSLTFVDDKISDHCPIPYTIGKI